MTWTYHRRAPDFDALAEAWTAHLPVLVTGPSGIGKTSLARDFARGIDRRPLWIIGTPAMKSTPLAAVTAAVPVDDSGTPSLVVDLLRTRLADGAMVIVEAAEHLDPASAAVVARLFRSVAQAGIITANGELDPALGAMFTSAGGRRVEVSPLDLQSVTAVVEHRVGAPVATADAARLARITEGNPFLLTQFVDGAITAGAFGPGDDGDWHLQHDMPVGDGLRSIAEEWFGQARPSERRLIDLLSLCEPLPRSVVDHLGLTDGISHAEGGLVLPLDDVVVPGHAILTELRRSQTGVLERRRLADELVKALGAVDVGPVARLHRARLALEYGLPLDVDSLAEGAGNAFLAGDLTLTERLARTAIERGAGLPAQLQASRALAGMGRAAEARAVLSDVDPDSLDEGDLAGFAITIAINLSLGEGDHAGALVALDKFEPRVETPSLRAAFHGLRAVTSIHAGYELQALTWARRAQQIGTEAPLWVALGEYVEAEALRRSGEVHRPIARAEAALQRASSTAALVGTGAQRTLAQALLADGQLDRAAEVADRLIESALLQHVSYAIACSTMALVEAAQGKFAAARHHCVETLRSLDDDDRTGLGRGTAMHLTTVCAMSGDVDAARRAAATSARATTATTGWAAINPELANAFVRIAEGEVVAPLAVLRSVAATCVAARKWSDALTVLHWAVRMGDAAAAVELCAVAESCEGGLTRVMGDHAAAVRDSHPGRLSTVSAEFAQLGTMPSAIDALGQAILAHRAAGDWRAARSLESRFRTLLDACEPMTSPVIRHVQIGVVLTPRELEAATMVAAGWTSNRIAEQLGVQAPTVSTLLARTKAKLSDHR